MARAGVKVVKNSGGPSDVRGDGDREGDSEFFHKPDQSQTTWIGASMKDCFGKINAGFGHVHVEAFPFCANLRKLISVRIAPDSAR